MPEISSGDTAWLLIATALVMVMLPGLALFYGGLVRRKNVLSTIMHSFFGLALISVVWVLWRVHPRLRPRRQRPRPDRRPRLPRPSRASGSSPSTLYARHDPVRALRGVPADVRRDHAGPDLGRVRGAQALRRVRALHGPVVDRSSTRRSRTGSGRPGGWLLSLGALDFAGGTVVHIASGVSALIVAMMIGRRTATGTEMEPHDVPDDRPRRGPALVRLVRVQRGLGTRCERPRGARRCW